jgi:lysyl-tRNA synthetase class 2
MKHKRYFEKILFISEIKKFFINNGFYEISPSPLVENPGMEPHIHPLEVVSVTTKNHFTKKHGYLHSSPEFAMKRVLALDTPMTKIFTLAHSFRDEPHSPHHRKDFLMLEWYRKNEPYESIMQDCFLLLKHLIAHCPFLQKDLHTKIEQYTIDEMISLAIQKDILFLINLSPLEFASYLKKNYPEEIPLPSTLCSWDDYFFLLWLNIIEPKIKNKKNIIIKEWPKALAALSSLHPMKPHLALRFEWYLNGIEVANCFQELTDLSQQKLRYEEFSQTKKNIYDYQLTYPHEFFTTMQAGLPPSSGIALGVERLFGILSDSEEIFYDQLTKLEI